MNDLDKLKELLFGEEKEALDSIAERIGRREMRASDVADVLPEAIHQSHRKDSDLVDAMTEPVGECLQKAFHDDPQTYGDALYPVMGPAIRKSIVHALKNLSQQINQAVEHSLTPKGIGWRIQASRAGIPFGEFLLQKTLLFRVEQAYLISRENGLLVEHVHHEGAKIKDSDAVSAMFTAIQDFVKESFSPDKTGRLESADMGEFTLWAVHGPHALLVCVIRGTPPRRLRTELSAVLERIHFRYGEALKHYQGDTATIPDVREDLEECLAYQALQESAGRKRGYSIPLLLLAAGLAAWLVYYLFQGWQDGRRLAQLQAALDGTPGVHVAAASIEGNRFLVRGMRDPLSRPIAEIVADLDIPFERIDARLEAFQSLDPDVQRRRIARLIDNEAISFELTGSELVLSGVAPGRWIDDARQRLGALPGLGTVDLSRVVNSDLAQLENEIAAMTGTRFFFSDGTRLDGDAIGNLHRFAARLRNLQASAARLQRGIALELVGSTDSTGTDETNQRLARQRAERVAEVLSGYGIAWQTYRDASAADSGDAPGEAPARRYVAVNLALDENMQ